MRAFGGFILGVSITLNILELYYILKNKKHWEESHE